MTPADEGFAAERAFAAAECADARRDHTLERLAQEVLGISLAERGSDSLDFHDIGVVSLRRLLEEAYRAGQEEMI